MRPLCNTAPPSNFRVVSACDPYSYLFIDKTGKVVCAPWQLEDCLDGVDTGVWTIEVALNSRGGLLGGVSIVNAKTGQALRSGNQSPVSLIDPKKLDAWSTWNFGIGDGTSPFVAARPMADFDQNLVIQGNCSGYNVLSWTWSGGDSNELWQFGPYNG